MKHAKLFVTPSLAGLLSVSVTAPAYAYVDPGTASLVLQAVLGALGAAAVTMGVYWRKFTRLFRRHGSAAQSPAPEPSSVDQDSR